MRHHPKNIMWILPSNPHTNTVRDMLSYLHVLMRTLPLTQIPKGGTSPELGVPSYQGSPGMWFMYNKSLFTEFMTE